MSAPEPELAAFAREAGLAEPGEDGEWAPLAGGVSSDIWKVSLRSGDYCVKRALAQLRVAANWTAPVDRNAHEWDYLHVAARVVPGHVPEPIAHDPARGLFAMAWLPPERHRLWKTELLAGRVDRVEAAAVGDLLGRLHAATARDPTIPQRFATDINFHALRIDPYLLATADAHPQLGDRLRAIARTTADTRRVLVHGDVSPKNVLLGPDGPVLIDAECAWFGDPAFDFAFCLNHLVIKARIVAGARPLLVEAGKALRTAYFAHVDWEAREGLAARAALLLPALALARVDGKSPLEYLDEAQRVSLRHAAGAAVAAARSDLSGATRALLA